MLLSSPNARLITFFKTRLTKFLSEQLTHDRSYINPLSPEQWSVIFDAERFKGVQALSLLTVHFFFNERKTKETKNDGRFG